MKANILRQAQLGRALGRGSSLASAARLSLQPLRAPVSAARPAVRAAPLAVPAFRSYSADAAQPAAQAGDEVASKTPITEFSRLSELGVHPRLISSLTEGMKYETMTAVQSMAINPCLQGKDIVAQAKTGTGKTLAFLVPLVNNILQADPNLTRAFSRRPARPDDIRAIILSPTRELAEQISVEARKLTSGTCVQVQIAVGGTQKRSMLQKVRNHGCHILVATPGRLYDLLSDPTSGIDAPKLTTLVLDEADRMLDIGFDRELQQIVSLLPRSDEQPRQTMLFSATMPSDVIKVAKTYVDPSRLEFVQTINKDDAPTHHKVPQQLVTVKGYENYLPALVELIHQQLEKAHAEPGARPFKAMVFLNTTNMVKLTNSTLISARRANRAIPEILSIHSRFTQTERNHAANSFRNARSAILVSSDVTARGMDFPNVTHVIQIGVPPDRDQYIHRLGRTGRANQEGQGWIMVTETDMRVARNTLTDLPIKKVGGIESANLDLADPATEENKFIATVKGAYQRMPSGLLNDTYLSFLGGSGKFDGQALIDQLNDWSRNGWGMEEPPMIPMKIAQLRGLTRLRGVNIGDRPERDSFGGGRGGRDGGRDGGRGGGFSRGGDRDRRPRDIFDSISQQQRNLERPSRRTVSF